MAHWQKGQSGNPSGRPQIPDELKAKLKDGFEEVVSFWFETLRNEEVKWDYRNRAAENIANYGIGKPREAIDMDISGKLEGFTIEITKKIDES